MTNNDKINELIQDFSCINTNQERVSFEQKLIPLLADLSESERKVLFTQFFENILSNIKSLGNDLTDTQLSNMEKILTIKELNLAA